MAMSRKHYTAVADILAAELSIETHSASQRAVSNVARSLADVFASDNPNFDRSRFYTAVGL
jgi:hypothetical protein